MITARFENLHAGRHGSGRARAIPLVAVSLRAGPPASAARLELIRLRGYPGAFAKEWSWS